MPDSILDVAKHSTYHNQTGGQYFMAGWRAMPIGGADPFDQAGHKC